MTACEGVPAAVPAEPLAFIDLPNEVLELTASLGLTEAQDVASFAAASKRCAAVCKAAPLRLSVAAPPTLTPREEQAGARMTLQALCTSWPGIAELDLQGSPLEDQDVLQALHRLPSLAALKLSGCKKLTPGFTASLASHATQRPSAAAAASTLGPAPLLRAVTLQRCFQLTSAALSDVLATAGAPGSKLACAALSHLNLADWPEQPVAGDTVAAAAASVAEQPEDAPAASTRPPAGLPSLPAGTLRMLALHNCSKLNSRTLHAIAAACPNLEVLMLGGSAFVLDEPALDGSSSSGGGSDGGGSFGVASGSSTGPAAGAAASACTWADGPSANLAQFAEMAQAAALEGMPALGGFSAYVATVAADLALMALSLPHLRVLELTFNLPGLVPALQCLARTEPLLAGREEPLQVWDLCSATSVAQAMQWRRDVYSRHCAAGGRSAITPTDATTFLAAAVNCSSAGRQTALHAAAEDANPVQLKALLGMGAQVDARDRSGATPLFLASEAGHVQTVECLLAAGASATLRNSAGEAPLYIAALKGHEPVVDLLLQHCQERGISWQAQRLYDGDGWTPLMAAAVGGRTAIVLKLLEAAGESAGQLVQAVNRYGQTAVHIAARKGSASLLRCLVDAGGAASLLTADCDGKTAAEIARRNGNGSAMRVLGDAGGALRREQLRQRGTVPTAERPRANDHRAAQGAQRWVGRRLQQRKGSGGGGGGGGCQGQGSSH